MVTPQHLKAILKGEKKLLSSTSTMPYQLYSKEKFNIIVPKNIIPLNPKIFDNVYVNLVRDAGESYLKIFDENNNNENRIDRRQFVNRMAPIVGKKKRKSKINQNSEKMGGGRRPTPIF